MTFGEEVSQPLAGISKCCNCYRITLKVSYHSLLSKSCPGNFALYWGMCYCTNASVCLWHLLDWTFWELDEDSLILHHKTDTKLLTSTRMTSAPGLQNTEAQAARQQFYQCFLGLQQSIGTKAPVSLPISWNNLS